MAQVGDLPDRCPRCGAAFRCGANAAEPCACTSLVLSESALVALRVRYAGCLCLRCLHELAAGADPAADGVSATQFAAKQ